MILLIPHQLAGIYFHIPFCKQACYYCNFYFSISLSNKKALVNALKKELLLRKNELENDTIKTIYFGGGTPSILSIEELQSIFQLLYLHYNIATDAEITIEANPDDLNDAYIFELSQLPVNRLSIGVQSFFDDDLKFMNRAHTAKESVRCLESSLRYFDNITIDLIYGIPNMSLKKWQENLTKTFDLNIPHISCYALTVEEKTALAHFIKKGMVAPLDEELALAHFNILVEESQKRHFINYETSNFGKTNYFSKHNTAYWLGQKYIGIGPAAHSFSGNERSWNISNNFKYIKSINQHILPKTVENLTADNRFNEYVMTGLRTIWGVSLLKVKSSFGEKYYEQLSNKMIAPIKQQLLKKEVLKNGDVLLKTTKKGRFLVDGIASDLFIV